MKSWSNFPFIDTFGDKPQCLLLGSQSRKPEGLKRFREQLKEVEGLVALSVNPEGEKYRKQTPRLALGVFRRVDKDKTV